MILVAGIATLVFSGVQEKTAPPEREFTEVNPIPTPKIVELCFYTETPTMDSNYVDAAWLRMNLQGGVVTGEFYNIPAQKDRNVGTFEGTVTPVIPEMMVRIADVWWDAMSEGMITKQELRIMFGEGTASVGYGTLVDRGDGVYVYSDKENMTYWQQLSDVVCSDIDDRKLVPEYIRANITSLVPEEPVLGGTFYAFAIRIDPATKTGTMKYEDGHIAGEASFSYTRNGNDVALTNIQKID